MSTLRKYLTRPETYLLTLLLLAILAGADSFRAPTNQVTAKVYVGGVRAYQMAIRPIIADTIQCRFRPTCSEYSIGSVKKHGIKHGLVLTYNRLRACRTTVPMGTIDLVPDQ